jgi:hypothetical protein
MTGTKISTRLLGTFIDLVSPNRLSEPPGVDLDNLEAFYREHERINCGRCASLAGPHQPFVIGYAPSTMSRNIEGECMMIGLGDALFADDQV